MEFELNNRKLKYENDEFYIKIEKKCNWGNEGDWKKIIDRDRCGYRCIHIGNKSYQLHRIIGMLFLNLDINDTKQHIDHIDGNKSNNNLDNLRIVSHQKNCFNFTKAKGYFFDKKNNKFQSSITLNGKSIFLGRFDTEEEAREAYLQAKEIYHKI